MRVCVHIHLYVCDSKFFSVAVVVGGAVGGVVLAVVLITIISLAVVVCLHQRYEYLSEHAI